MVIRFRKTWSLILLTALSLWVNACSSNQQIPPQSADGKLQVVATTTFIGDVVGRIAGDLVDLTVLLEPGQNPHAYQPTPQDMVKVSNADLIFVNGLGLEGFLDELLKGADASGAVVVVNEGNPELITGAQEEASSSGDLVDNHSGQDPHVWFDPNLVSYWTDQIATALATKDPENAAIFQGHAASYRKELTQLDSWIRAQVDKIPPENRELVNDHTAFGYFAARYGFVQIGAVIPALTTEAETSGQQLADLVETIRSNQVKAIFVGVDFDPTLAQRVADETDVPLVPLYFGSLSDGSPAGTYLDFMRTDVQTIVDALK